MHHHVIKVWHVMERWFAIDGKNSVTLCSRERERRIFTQFNDTHCIGNGKKSGTIILVLDPPNALPSKLAFNNFFMNFFFPASLACGVSATKRSAMVNNIVKHLIGDMINSETGESVTNKLI